MLLARAATLVGLLALLSFPGVAGAEVIDRIVAIVNDQVITLRDVKRAALPLLMVAEQVADEQRRQVEEQKALARTVEDLVGQALVIQEARKLKLAATPAEVDAWLANLRQQYGWTDEQLQGAIEAQGTTMLQYREDVRRRIVTNRAVQVKLGSSVRVSDQDVDEVYTRLYGDSSEDLEVAARHILFLASGDTDAATVAAQEAKARAAVHELKAGADFGALARERSEGPSASKGGDLGSFRPASMVPEFAAAVTDAPVGEIVGPVRTEFGFHVIQVRRRRLVEARDREGARNEIRAQLRKDGLERQLKLWVDELKRTAFVDVRL